VAIMASGGMQSMILGPRGQPRPIDLDGDGRFEVVMARRGAEGKGLFTLVFFDPPDPVR
jgi:hypothetical protein